MILKETMMKEMNVAMLDCFSDAAFVLQPESIQIYYMNAPCRALLGYEGDVELTDFFRDLRVMQAMFCKECDEQLRTLTDVFVTTADKKQKRCDVKIRTLTNGIRCCVITPAQSLAESGAFQSLLLSQDADSFFFRAAQEKEAALLFRLELKTKTMHYFGYLLNASAVHSRYENYPQNVIESGLVYPPDNQLLWDFMDNIAQGKEEPSVYRVRESDGSFVWHQKEYLLCRDADGNVVEVVGKIVNVQAIKEREEKSSLDKLTGCLIKHDFESAATEYIDANSGQQHALMMIDLDNFKAINDNLGHQFGDMVLREVGEKMRKTFRSTDLLGRVGGDEFMVFLQNIADKNLLKKKADEISALLDNTYKGEYHHYHVSASIGIAVFPKDGQSFQELYEKADIALYDAKNRGKNAYVFYNDTLSKGTMENTLPFDIANRTLSQYFDGKIVAEVFNLLYESHDLDISMQTVLQIIGRRFAVSRAYIFERNQTSSYANTYEWCAEGVRPEIENLQEVPVCILTPFFSEANGDGILYCNDLSALQHEDARALMEAQNIKSFLHAYIGPSDRATFIMGFDDCDTTRIWRPIEISTLLHVSKIIAQFLNQSNTLRTVQDMLAERTSVLGALNFSAYVVDIDNHRLTYVNDYMKGLLPELQLGDTCYRAIRDYHAECADCPLRNIRNGETSGSRSVVRNEKLGRDMLINAIRLQSFDGKASVFVTADDVTDLISVKKIT